MSPRAIAFEFLARAACGSGNKKDIVDEDQRTNKVLDLLSPTIAGWLNLICSLTWGSAALHPRLYAFARYRGLVERFSARAVLDDRFVEMKGRQHTVV